MRLNSLCAVGLGLVLGFVGCGAQEQSGANYSTRESSGKGGEGQFADPPARVAQEAAGAPAAAADPGDPDNAPPISRKIIYNATIELTVTGISGMAEDIARLVAEAGGYVSNSSLRGTSGTRRSGTWTVRVPSERFDEFLRQVSGLGELNSITTTSQEVTAEYYDAEARLRNKRREEERLLTLLESGAGTLQDVLEVETAISRVRQEVEQLEGRLRVLRDLTALSSVTIHASEIAEFVAATPGDFPSFGERVSKAWTGGWDAMAAAGQRLAIVAVAATPWIVVLALPAVVLFAFVRRLSRASGRVEPGQKAA